MNSPLLELIFLSEKRKDLILFLNKGPKTIEQIKKYMNASAVAVLPQLKKLRDDSAKITVPTLMAASVIAEVKTFGKI